MPCIHCTVAPEVTLIRYKNSVSLLIFKCLFQVRGAGKLDLCNVGKQGSSDYTWILTEEKLHFDPLAPGEKSGKRVE